MNERIKTLLEQARTKDYWSEGRYLVDFINQEQFAELIIQECIDKIEANQFGDGGEFDSGCRSSSNAIKQHFGVEGEL